VPTPASIHAFPDQLVPRAKPRTGWRIFFSVVGLLVLAACALTILILIGINTGRTGFLLGAVLATLPVPLLVAAFRWLDKYEPEPPRYLVFAFVWGGAVATLVAITLNTVGTAVFFTRPGEAGIGWEAVFLAPPVEEAAKGAVVLVLALRRRIDGIVDGIVFAGLCGVGFAFTENILYYGRAYAEGTEELGTGGGVAIAIFTFVLRGIASPFAHPLFTLPIGIAIGIAVQRRSTLAKIVLPLLGYAVAVTLHALWNGSALRGLGTFALGYVAIMLPAMAAAIGLAIWFRRREGRVLNRRLPAFAEAGWIAPHEVALLSSLRLRQLGLDLATHFGGKEARRATRAYQEHVVGLGYLRERLARGRRVEADLVTQGGMLGALFALRSRAIVPPPPPPPRQAPRPGPPPYGSGSGPPVYGSAAPPWLHPSGGRPPESPRAAG
jgi:RsiW-degrading membrane proteinase PrsW (M82 family)